MVGRATFRKGAKVARIERNLDDPDKTLTGIGAVLVAAAQATFKEQKLGRKKWEQRAPVNIYGLIADFSQGKKAPAKRRFDRRPALVDTGRLRSSIAFRLIGSKVVEVGTPLRYGDVHQTGGKVKSEPIAPIRKALWRWLKRQNLEMRRRLGFLFAKKFDQGLEGEVPARPFIGFTRQTRKAIQKTIGVTLVEVKK